MKTVSLFIGTFFLLTLTTSLAFASDADGVGIEHVITSPAMTVNAVPPALYPPKPLEEYLSKSRSSSPIIQEVNYPLFGWPLSIRMNEKLVLVNYVDDDTSSAIRDFMGNPHSYDGHRGTDYCLLNFRQMDRGIPIYAAAPGVVAGVAYQEFDRNTNWGNPPYPPANYVIIRHSDNSYAYYWHMRTNSPTVQVGETIQQGDQLGLVGSSGMSTDAHLHFELGQYENSNWVTRDPWFGTNNPLPSLWSVQEPYVGTLPMRVFDMGVTTQAAAGGSLNDVSMSYLKNGFSQPLQIGASEPYIMCWFQDQNQAGDTYTISLRTPSGRVYSQSNTSIANRYQYAWFYWYWNFSGYVTSADYGIWEARIVTSSATYTKSFRVGSTTQYLPRFIPFEGKSFRINGTVQRDTIRFDSASGIAGYQMVNAWPGITMQNNVVTIPATSNQIYRSAQFQVVATNSFGSDTMWYQVVDFSKPLLHVNSVNSDPSASIIDSFAVKAYPNPFNSSVTLQITTLHSPLQSIQIYDLNGREVFQSTHFQQQAGSYRVTIDGKSLPSGTYFVRLQANGASKSQKIVLLK